MNKNVLNVLEQRSLAKGLASESTRLKAGRIIWDEIDAGLPQAIGEAERDVDRLDAFKKMVEARPYYEKRALKEWLAAQINTEYPDVIGDDTELSKMLEIYKEHLTAITTPQF